METVLHEFNFFLIGSKMSVSFELWEKHEQNQHGAIGVVCRPNLKHLYQSIH